MLVLRAQRAVSMTSCAMRSVCVNMVLKHRINANVTGIVYDAFLVKLVSKPCILLLVESSKCKTQQGLFKKHLPYL